MSSDQDYAAFLDKANQDPSEGKTAAQASGAGGGKKAAEFRTTESGVAVPEALRKAAQGKFYTSDADEPFVPFALRWEGGEGGLPDEEQFATLIRHWNPVIADVEILDASDWDRQGQYGELVDAVAEASKGSDVRVYRVGRDGTRSEYWVVTACEGKIVGVKALAVES
ncbi:uncharacterized protein E0L32_006366 [Thyridium curvatum]|uniref:Uncharacterized protein n=1 Tax=Thyridium curvatum TaxID=1093900 RepID=A0A507B267_9PEZI|nr:uncharacterized protein E0L32_006366 [Thyridium curvatum]TPX13166.1 hypothetical protein E0L32_006366 [Thyridium curvatum]